MDRSLGAVVGAFIGDSMGSFLEFKNEITSNDVEIAIKMPGGGFFDVMPGQVTDDSELAIALARALCDMEGIFDVEKIASRYIEWFKSGPFDKGRTISNALFGSENATDCRVNAQRTKYSESNGGLMRISPLAVYCSLIDDESLVEKIVRKEQSLTHANETAQDAAVAYVFAIRDLIRNGTCDCKRVFDTFLSLHEYVNAIRDRLTGNKNIGHAKIAWSYAFYHLQKKSTFLEAMRDVLSRGGDTDTNCAIVGGLIGASIGFEQIKKEIPEQIKKFMECIPNHRPYVPYEIVGLVKYLQKTYENDK